jgi:hypothetical protein
MAKRLFSPLKRKENWDNAEFSLKLLEKELELEKNCAKPIIEDLITLYSEAIEHYNEISDIKFYDYQDRLHNMLMRPEVVAVMDGNGLNNLYNVVRRRNICSEQVIKSKLLEKEKVLRVPKVKSEDFTVKKEKIADNLNRQDSDLQSRIRFRRNKANESFQANDISTKGSYYLDEKDQMEMIMEKYYEKKAKEVSDISLFYLMKMESADQAKKDLLAQEMKREILRVSEKYDCDRAEKLKKFKKVHKIK